MLGRKILKIVKTEHLIFRLHLEEKKKEKDYAAAVHALCGVPGKGSGDLHYLGRDRETDEGVQSSVPEGFLLLRGSQGQLPGLPEEPCGGLPTGARHASHEGAARAYGL